MGRCLRRCCGESYRTIAEVLLGFSGTKEDWEIGPRKNKARRLVAHGIRMMRGGYRLLLNYRIEEHVKGLGGVCPLVYMPPFLAAVRLSIVRCLTNSALECARISAVSRPRKFAKQPSSGAESLSTILDKLRIERSPCL